MYVTKINSSLILDDNSRSNYYFEYKKNLKLFQGMFSFWQKDIIKTNELIKKYKDIYIFGAHIFSQLMLFNGLNKKKISAVLDNDKKKISKFLYGTNFKIYNPIVLKKSIKPCVILRAGSYNDEIKKQLYKINKNTIVV